MARTQQYVVLALIVALAARGASAASYVGCFPASSFSTATTPAASVEACEQTCAGQKKPLIGMIGGAACGCSGMIPTGAVDDSQCASGDASVVAVYYRSSDSGKGCRVNHVPLVPENWVVEPSYVSSTQVKWEGTDGVTLSLIRDVGPRLNTKDATGYGIYQARVKACGVHGCNSAFYMTSDLSNANTDQDEVDMEFINAHPSTGPGGLWPNSWVNAQRKGPERLSAVMDTYNTFRTYSMDWQPSGITWFVDGNFLDFQPPPTPSKQLHTLVSIWTKNNVDFGGEISMDHEPWYASFNSVHRLLCDGAPKDIIVTASVPAVSPSPSPAVNITTATASPSPSPEVEPSPSPEVTNATIVPDTTVAANTTIIPDTTVAANTTIVPDTTVAANTTIVPDTTVAANTTTPTTNSTLAKPSPSLAKLPVLPSPAPRAATNATANATVPAVATSVPAAPSSTPVNTTTSNRETISTSVLPANSTTGSINSVSITNGTIPAGNATRSSASTSVPAISAMAVALLLCMLL